MRIDSWVRRPQEKEGMYQFDGAWYITQEVSAKLRPAEIIAICMDIRCFVAERGGADYFQVYDNPEGEKLYLIDATSTDENYCVLMYSHEY